MRRKQKVYLNKLMAENFPNLGKNWVGKSTKQIEYPYYLNAKRPLPNHLILAFSKVNDKERIL